MTSLHFGPSSRIHILFLFVLNRIFNIISFTSPQHIPRAFLLLIPPLISGCVFFPRPTFSAETHLCRGTPFVFRAIFTRARQRRVKNYFGPLNGAFIDFLPARGVSTFGHPSCLPGLTDLARGINVLFYQWSAAAPGVRAVVVIIFGTRRGHSRNKQKATRARQRQI